MRWHLARPRYCSQADAQMATAPKGKDRPAPLVTSALSSAYEHSTADLGLRWLHCGTISSPRPCCFLSKKVLFLPLHPEVSCHATCILCLSPRRSLGIYCHMQFSSLPYTAATHFSTRKEGKKRGREYGKVLGCSVLGRCPCLQYSGWQPAWPDLLLPPSRFPLADSPPRRLVLLIWKNSLWTSRPASWRWRAVRVSPEAPASPPGVAAISKAKAHLTVREGPRVSPTSTLLLSLSLLDRQIRQTEMYMTSRKRWPLQGVNSPMGNLHKLVCRSPSLCLLPLPG